MRKALLLTLIAAGAAFVNCYAADPIYTAIGEVTPSEGWGDTPMPSVRDVKLDAYEDYVIINAFAGVEGYDMKVGLGANDAITFVSSIVDGVEGDAVSSGYATIYTGLEDIPYIRPYIRASYCYGSSDAAEESGYVIMSAYIGDDWSYYNFVWPQGNGEVKPWTNPFEAEATFLYSAKGTTGNAPEWEDTVFPLVENINIDVYDTYVYIHGIGGVQGYDLKVAYNSEDEVLSMIPVTNGVEEDACKTYCYVPTGRTDYYMIQPYCESSFAGQSTEDKTGYVCLGAYIYDNDDNYYWNYYYCSWTGDEGVASAVNDSAEDVWYNVLGLKVDQNYRGIVISNGKKQLRK